MRAFSHFSNIFSFFVITFGRRSAAAAAASRWYVCWPSILLKSQVTECPEANTLRFLFCGCKFIYFFFATAHLIHPPFPSSLFLGGPPPPPGVPPPPGSGVPAKPTITPNVRMKGLHWSKIPPHKTKGCANCVGGC